MSANTHLGSSWILKAFAAALAALVVLAPGATAIGALDATGTLNAAGSASADASGALAAVDEVAKQAQATVNGALDTVSSVKADVALEADVDARPAVDGAAEAGTGFFATAKGYFDSLLNGIMGLFGQAQAEAEIAADEAIATVDDAQADARADVEANAYMGMDAVSQIEVPEPPPVPAPPKVSTSLTASLQAAFGGLIGLRSA